jgi:acetoacetyl-CoA synthetase
MRFEEMLDSEPAAKPAPMITVEDGKSEPAAAPRTPPLIVLRTGTDRLPIFMTHGLGGTVSDLQDLATHINSENPIFGIQARGLDGLDEPHRSIEDMAVFALDAIKQVQRRGPYLLVGYSLGGLVMLEAAQRLSSNAEDVLLLAMLETYPHRRFLSLAQRARISGRLVRSHVSQAMRLPLRGAVSYIAHRVKRKLLISSKGYDGVSFPPPPGTSLPPQMQQVRDSAYLAWTRYRPHHYRGKIAFVRAEVSSEFPDDPAAVWGGLAEELQVETVPGDHSGILTTHFKSLASTLSRYLREAIERKCRSY